MISPGEKLHRVRHSAEKRGFECTLTIEDVAALLAVPVCALCGEPFELKGERMLTFERLSPKAGYTKENTCAAHAGCNFDKGIDGDHRIRIRKARKRHERARRAIVNAEDAAHEQKLRRLDRRHRR